MATTNGMAPTHEENGREFHGWRKGLYMFPCDEPEKERMDIYHTMFLVARHQRLHNAPMAAPTPNESTRILDVGTGTGIWAIDIADKYTEAEVIGIDLANIQPPTIPPNLRFRVPKDYESMWALGEDSFDLIHMRLACGGVSSWPEIYHKIYGHLKPGIGHVELVEIDLKPRCDSGPIPPRLMQWYGWLEDATYRGGKPIQYQENTRELLRQQGFVNIDEEVIRLPFNTWPEVSHRHDEKEKQQVLHERDIGRWYSLGLCEGLEALSLGPLTRVYGWPAEDVRRLCSELKQLICNRQNKIYHNLHIFTARKPPASHR